MDLIKKKFFIVGGDSFIGKNLLAVLKKKDLHVLSTYKSSKEFGDIKFCLGSDSAKKLPIGNVDFLIICASKT